MKQKVRLGLRIKWIFVVVSFILLISLAIYFVSSWQITNAIREELAERGLTLAKGLAYNSEYGLFTENKDILENLIMGVMKAPDVSYCVIYDGNRNLLVSSGEIIKPMEKELRIEREHHEIRYIQIDDAGYFDIIAPVVTVTAPREEAESGLFVTEEEWIREIRKPEETKVRKKIIGYVRVGVTERRTLENINRLKRNIAGISGIVTLFVILITIFFVNRLIKPIRLLSMATQSVASGDLAHRVRIKRKDELGILADSFDKMTEEISTLIQKEKELTLAEREEAKKLEKAYKELKEMQDRLIRSEKLAALGKLAGSVSHELRNPLGVIRNSVFFLRMKLGKLLEDPKIKKHLDILDEEVNTSDRIITDTLTFGRIKEPQLAKSNINDAIKDSLARIEVPENIELSTQLKSDLPETLADSNQLQQVFSNIILNAVQAMPKGGKLTIASITINKSIIVEISDTGEGIPKENLDKIFEPLFSTRPKGTGLGLSICQSIIEMHKGTIEVESELGKGTKFTVTLPLLI